MDGKEKRGLKNFFYLNYSAYYIRLQKKEGGDPLVTQYAGGKNYE